MKRKIEYTYKDIKIPKNAIMSNIKSIPFFVRFIASSEKSLFKAAAIHSYLYKAQGFDYWFFREEIDKIFFNEMKELKISKWKRIILYFCIRAFSSLSFRHKAFEHHSPHKSRSKTVWGWWILFITILVTLLVNSGFAAFTAVILFLICYLACSIFESYNLF